MIAFCTYPGREGHECTECNDCDTIQENEWGADEYPYREEY